MLDIVMPADMAAVILEYDLYKLFLSLEHQLAMDGQEDRRVILVNNVFQQAIRLNYMGIALHLGS